MAAIARTQSSSCAMPVLDLFTSTDGVLVDVHELSFQIFDRTGESPVQVYPLTPGARAAVNVLAACPAGDRLGVGHYVARWTAPVTATVGTHEIRWFIVLAPGTPEQPYGEAFEVLPEVVGSTSLEPSYVTVADMREEGVPMAVTDAFLRKRIALASRMVEQATGRFFVPRRLTVRVNGTGQRRLYLRNPIIAVETIGLGGAPAYDPSEFVVYNRHVREDLMGPDDRSDPFIELVGGSFARGSQNIHVTGVFGYTDPDPPNPFGKTPDLIKHVTKLLVIRELDKLGTAAGMANRFDKANRHRLTSERTRDQAYTLNPSAASTGVGGGFFTGDPEIDRILSLYARPMQIASV